VLLLPPVSLRSRAMAVSFWMSETLAGSSMCGLAKAQVDGCVCGMCGGVALRKKNKTASLQVGELLRSEGEHARCSCRQAASSRLLMWMCVLLCVVCVEGGVVLCAELGF